MPIYVYECSQCKDVFEVQQRIVEDALTDCHCGAQGTVKRVIQPVGIAFKGSGFYVNDSSSSSAPAKAEDSATASKEAPATAPADSTPTVSTTATPTSENVSS
jgi:putative FmdB family regulatory protein